MLDGFLGFVKNKQLFTGSDRVLLAVSGGIDSVVMARLFSMAGLSFGIAHCDFSLRGKESESDALFTEDLARTLKAPFFLRRFRTAEYAASKKISVQMAARELRYAWFGELRQKGNFSCTATAHHLDDQIETFLINLIRGTGISGLHGILPRQGHIIRPMMFAFRKDIEHFAREKHIEFREDRSNQEEKYLRNKIRKTLLPLLEEINPDIRNTLTREIARLRDWETLGREAVKEKAEKLKENRDDHTVIDLNSLKKSVPAELLAWEILSPYGFNSSVVAEILSSAGKKSGKTFLSPDYRAVRHRTNLIIQKKTGNIVASTRLVQLKTKRLLNPVPLRFSVIENTPKTAIPLGREFASLDFDKLCFPLEIRIWKAGDSFQPYGFHGKKKVSDFLIDARVPVTEKEQTLVLCSSGKIAWVIGHRIDHRFRITARTRQIYRIRLIR